MQVASSSWGNPWLAKKKGPQSYKHKKLNSANDLNELGREFFPRASRKLSLDLSFVRPWAENWVTQCWTFDPQIYELINGYYFKLQSLWLILGSNRKWIYFSMDSKIPKVGSFSWISLNSSSPIGPETKMVPLPASSSIIWEREEEPHSLLCYSHPPAPNFPILGGPSRKLSAWLSINSPGGQLDQSLLPRP